MAKVIAAGQPSRRIENTTKSTGATVPNSMSTLKLVPESPSPALLSIAVISPDASHREEIIAALARFPDGRIREFISYSRGADAAAQVLREDFDVVIIDLDSAPEHALELVENICADGSTNVIVCSANSDPAILLRCMRAGTREFLPMPISHDAMSEAMLRLTARRQERPAETGPKRNLSHQSNGKLLLFMSAKGGLGTTTLSCGLAVSLSQEFHQSTLLIDLNLPLGDAALNLALKGEYSTVDALNNFHRLDGSLLTSLVTRHESGLYVLPAPAEMNNARFENEMIFKLLRVARQEFDYVVVDIGSSFDAQDVYMLDDSTTIFLVTQVGIPELRNSNRLVKQLVVEGGPKVEIVVNRHDSGSSDIDEAQIKKALTLPIQWKIPNDYSAVRRMQNLGTPLNQEDSEIARTIREMGESICGAAPRSKKKKKLLGLF
jgi:pilus assembly protein CpaE